MKKILTFILMLAAVMMASAQSRSALRINEVMVVNDSSVVDDYGTHVAWVELFNSNFAPLQIAKIFLTDDLENPTKYPVPVGDVNTVIPKRQHVVFWADNHPDKGTFHLNFALKPGQDNFLAIFDADGKTLIDSVTVPANLLPNQSYARATDGFGTWGIRDGQGENAYVTPSSANIIVSKNDKVEFFNERDENGFGLTVIAMGIVFSALLLLCICFYLISRLGAYVQYRNKIKSSNMQPTSETSKERRHDSGEEIAAIVMALHEHLNIHDQESAVLTLNKVKRAYSPWNSKIYNMRQVPYINKW